MEFMSDEYVRHALSVIERVLDRLDDARRKQQQRIEQAKIDIASIDEHLPDAILQSLVTGDRERVNALHHLRMLSERELVDADIVLNGRTEEGYFGVNGVGRLADGEKRRIGSSINRYELQAIKRRKWIIDRTNLDQIRCKGDPLTWWPAWLTAPDQTTAHAQSAQAPARTNTVDDVRSEARRLLDEGLSQSETARPLGISRRSVQRYAEQAAWPRTS